MLVTPEQVPFDLIAAAVVLSAVGLRKLVEMERFHKGRVAGLTFLLCVAVFYLFCCLFNHAYKVIDPHGCVLRNEEESAYSCVEVSGCGDGRAAEALKDAATL